LEIGERSFFDLKNILDFAKMILNILLPNGNQPQRSDLDIGSFLELISSGALKTFQMR